MENQQAPPVIQVQIPLTPVYVNKYVTLNQTMLDLEIELSEGEHQIITTFSDVGQLLHFSDPVLQARITLWYRYELKSNTITFCSNDLLSKDSPFITTAPRGTAQYCHQYTHNGNVPREVNPNWNQHTPLTPGLEDALQQTLRAANNTLIEKAKELGFAVIVRTPVPMIEQEEYEKYSAVYHRGKFMEFYDPEKAYGIDDTVQTIDSVWYGEIYLAATDNFANVDGSTRDPKVGGCSWIALWRSQFGVPDTCTSYNYGGFTCGAGLVGGHVIPGKRAAFVPMGSNYVFIMPICYAHNNNDNVYMAPVIYRMGIALHNYMGR